MPEAPTRTPPLVQLTATWGGEHQACFIDPEVVTSILPAGLPATSRVNLRGGEMQMVLGTPADVHDLLFPRLLLQSE